jgi:hypothetical protein
MEYPVTVLDKIIPACRPDEPLERGDPRYFDVAPLRHGVGLRPLQQVLRARPWEETAFIHRCVCGHRGSGKSTELHMFEKWAAETGYLPVRIEVDKRLGRIALEATDLFLLATLAAEEGLQSYNLKVSQKAIKNVGRWFAEVVREDKDEIKSELGVEASAQMKGGIFSLVELLAKFTASLKASSQHAQTVRERLRNYPDALVDMTNVVLREVNGTLERHGFPRGLLLIFDNLDRFEPDHIVKSLFGGSELVRLLRCNAVFVVPISLEYERSGPLQDCYGHFVVLPMLALREPKARWAETVAASAFDEGAVDQVVAMLGKRLDIAALFEDPEDARLLAKLSGGCLRDLMHLVTTSFGRCDEGDRQLTHAAIQGGIREVRASYKRQMDADDYKALALIATKHANQVEGDDLRKLLYRRMALEYLDADEQPWHDVHPLLIEIPEFQDARRSLS